MSVPPPKVRSWPGPRWSQGKPAGLAPALMAALPVPRAWVKVGPPLFESGPRFRAAPNGRLLALEVDSTPGPGSTPMALKLAVIRPAPPSEMSAKLGLPELRAKLPETIELV